MPALSTFPLGVHNANDEFTTVLVRPFCSQAFLRRGRILGHCAGLGCGSGVINIIVDVYGFCAIYVSRLTCCISGYSITLSKPCHPHQMPTQQRVSTFGGDGENRTPVQSAFYLQVPRGSRLAHNNSVTIRTICGGRSGKSSIDVAAFKEGLCAESFGFDRCALRRVRGGRDLADVCARICGMMSGHGPKNFGHLAACVSRAGLVPGSTLTSRPLEAELR